MSRKKQKQAQWGITILVGLFMLAGTVGHLELGGDVLPNIFKGFAGMIVSVRGLIKSYQWGLFDEE